MALDEPTLDPAELEGVTAPTLVIAADDAIAAEHTPELYRRLPDARLAVVPHTSHVLITEKPRQGAHLALDFLTAPAPAPAPIAPIRRRTVDPDRREVQPT